MKANPTWKKLMRVAIVALPLAAPVLARAAQPAKKVATKEPAAKAAPAKAAPIDDNGTWMLAGREGECAPVSLLCTADRPPTSFSPTTKMLLLGSMATEVSYRLPAVLFRVIFGPTV